MDRVRRLVQFWNWLPAFRAVGETQHLPTAAAQLGVSAPALSRTVKQLESELEAVLFSRSKGRIELNHAGRLMLRYVRDAMRLLDDGVQAVAASTFVGPVRIAASYSAQLSHVLPALASLRRDYPQLEPEVTQLDAGSAYQALKMGELDVVVVEDAAGDDAIDLEHIDRVDYAVFASPDHALASEPSASLDLQRCAEHLWAVPGSKVNRDGWHPHLPRRVGLRTPSLGIAIEACQRLGLLVHMPEVVGRELPQELCCLIPSGISQEMHIARRSKLSDQPDRVSVTIDAIRALVAARRANHTS